MAACSVRAPLARRAAGLLPLERERQRDTLEPERCAGRWCVMRYRADIIVYDRAGSPVLLAEIKRKWGASPQWAAELRRNMLAHQRLPSTRFFLVVVPDRLFLWGPTRAPDAQADVNEPAAPVLGPYIRASGVAPRALTEWGLEQVTSSWLHDLTLGRSMSDRSAPDWLTSTGLQSAVQGGKVRAEVVV